MPDWKRCEDEMPDECTRVIVSGVTGSRLFKPCRGVGEGYWMKALFSNKPIWMMVRGSRVRNVTHWQPLPAPPEEETP